MRNASLRTLRSTLLWSVGLTTLLAACGEDSDNRPGDPVGPSIPQPEPKPGQTDFVSADGRVGQESNDRGGTDAGASPGAPDDDFEGGGGGEERTVEEGDIYRVIAGKKILNLNYYRGVQVVDFSDVTSPKVIGRVAVSGAPVEAYVVGDKAIVLMNDYQSYYGSASRLQWSQRSGGVVLSIDLSDPTNPVITDRAFVPGYIQTSRLTRGNGQEALFIAAQVWGGWTDEVADGASPDAPLNETTTVVKSFSVTGGELTPRSQVNLGGYVTDIQATPQSLLVARHDYRWDSQRGSTVKVIDISSPEGAMVEGADVQVRGIVSKKTNMDMYKGVLRIVSGAQWGGTNTNHLETFDASDITNVTAIDHDTFGDGENLFGTLFLGNKAFFVTYLRVDPFHAFEITDEGVATEKSEFIVSGWNDWFRPVEDQTRLIGIGMNDENQSRTLSVSLYDITDLTNANPLISRTDVAMQYSWSEASWDDRAFSVLEDAVEAVAPDGTPETGLVLLPFSGWNDNTYRAAVQIYTFSSTTLTRRGIMEHGSPVRRSFQADPTTTANLSEEALSLFDARNPDEPRELGTVDLAPDYADLLTFGDFSARLKSNQSWSWYRNHTPPPSVVEIIRRSEHPDTAQPIATFEVPTGARLVKSGDLLVAMTSQYKEWTEERAVYETTLWTWDLSNPAEPVSRGELTTTEIPAGYGYYGGWDDCWECGRPGFGGGYYGESNNTYAFSQGIAFVGTVQEREFEGRERVCYYRPVDREQCWYGDREQNEGECYYGGVNCRTLEGQATVCEGQYYKCDAGYENCEPIGREGVATQENCYDNDRYRYWNRQIVSVVDLSDASTPRLVPSIEMPRENEAAAAMIDADKLWLSWSKPTRIEGDNRPYVRFYIQPVDLTNPGAPALGAAINVPGSLVAISGNRAYTQDTVWGESVVESALALVEIEGDLAYLRARRRFADQMVEALMLDNAGRVFVTHRTAWNLVRGDDNFLKLSLLDDATFDLRSTSRLETWATMRQAISGRALFQVGGGILVVNAQNAEAPVPQAFFPTWGWPSKIWAEGNEIIAPANRFGVYKFSLDTFNLIPTL